MNTSEVTRQVRFGIIGMGRMGQMYARLAQENAEATLAAICDTDLQRCGEQATLFGVPAYGSISELIECPDLDAVVVATPDFLHLEPVLAATERNLHVLIEKPLSTDLGQARQMREAAKKSSGVSMMAHVFRWSPPFVHAKAALDSRRLGEPIAMNMRIDDRIFVPTKMLKWARSTTPAWFLLSHEIDLACWYAGSVPVKVYATAVKRKLISMGIDTHDVIHADITFENGFVASVEACWTLPDSLPNMSGAWCTLLSTEGGQYINVIDQMVHEVGAQFETPATLRTDMYGRLAGLQSFMFQSFVDSILRDAPVVTSVEDGFRVVTVLESLHRSLGSGQVEYVEE